MIFADAWDDAITSESDVYATAREGGTLSLQPVATTVSVGQFFADGLYDCFEAFFGFDTSSIAGAITSVDFALYCFISDTDFTLEARLFDCGDSVETTDFQPGSALDSLQLLASLPTLGLGTAYQPFTDAAFTTNINQSGFTRCIVVSDRHRLDLSPSGLEYIAFSSADHTGTSQDPKLTIVYGETELPPSNVMFA